MVIMALDHVRDFVHDGAMTFSPEDLTQTTPLLFVTRWVTHICAPTFVFLAGVGACLRLQRDGSRSQLSRFLWTRGLWLVLVEVTVMRLAINFTFSPDYPVLLLVLWALGISMVVMAALVYLPVRMVAALALAVIVLHNTLDGVQASQFGSFSGLWNAFHQVGVFFIGGVPFVVGYPVLPWIAVMAAGFCFGHVFGLEPARRRTVLLATGGGALVVFVLLRAVNLYGDPSPWSSQPTALGTVLSFLRVTKYPPSLDFLLMTLGPALLGLAWFERRRLERTHPLVVIGRVPLFFYVVHFFAIHALAAVMAWLRYGEASLAFLFTPLPSMGGPRELYPAGFGYPLWLVYLVWIAVVLALYPLCRRFGEMKARRTGWWVSYV